MNVHPAAPAAPVWHVAPPQGWLNDPNGLCLADGRWHAYFQHHPHDDRWGSMHWGHVSSADGLHWQHHPVALEPDPLGTIFSGSVVHDLDGVAGAGRGAWVACFTHHTDDLQHQSLAFSHDRGLTWTKHPDNPVIRGDVADFRDPKVWRADDGRWHLVVTLADHLQFHVSDDLVHWRPTGEFRADLGEGVGNWECPDLVTLPGGGHLLVLSLSTGGPQGNSGTVVVPGRFDGAGFQQQGDALPFDHGPDWYAAQTFWNAGALHPVAMAWMNSWAYANEVPSRGTRGLLSLPRRLSWDADRGLRSWPAVRPTAVEERGAQWIEADGDVVVSIAGADAEVRAGVSDGEVFVERTGGLFVGHDGRFSAPIAGDGPHAVVVDHGSVEVFAADGRASVTAQVFAGVEPDVRVQRP
jgi:sucrose-6-phosphate hydrolase SacC (GH32 family)